MKRFLCTGLALTAGALMAVEVVGVVEAQGGQRAPGAQTINAPAVGDLEVLQLRPNFYMIAGAGGNIAVQVGEDGVVVVDTGSAARADAVVAAIKKLSPGSDPVHHQHQRRCGSCRRQRGGRQGGSDAVRRGRHDWERRKLGRAGASIIATEKCAAADEQRPTGQGRRSRGGVADRDVLSAAEVHVPQRRGVEVLHQPAAHTDGDASCSSAVRM